MVDFSYKAYLTDNKVEVGNINASNKNDAIRQLAAKNKRVFAIEAGNEVKKTGSFLKSLRRPNLVRFFEDLSELINAGLTVDIALKVMAENEPNSTHRSLYSILLQGMTEGQSLSSACSKHEIIPLDAIALIKAGEKSGQLGEVIKIISKDLKQSKERRSELFEMLSYPVFLIVIMCFAIAAITGFLVPAIEPLFESSNQEIPWVLSFFQSIKNFLSGADVGILGVLIFVFALFLLPTTRAYFKPQMHRFILRLPIIGKAIKDANLARYFQGLSLLLFNHVSLQESLKLAAHSSSNLFIKKALEGITEEVIVGRPVPDVLAETKLFDPEIISVVKVGDQVNKLPSVLKRASELMDTRSKRKVKSIMAFITPAITIFMGLIVGTLAFSVMTALLSINELAV